MFAAAVVWIAVGIRKSTALLRIVMAVVYGGLARYLTARGFVLIAPIYLVAPGCLLVGILILVRRRLEHCCE